jgi:hypothetical protein
VWCGWRGGRVCGCDTGYCGCIEYCGIGILEMGVEESGVEPCGRLVEGGREGCDRGSMM